MSARASWVLLCGDGGGATDALQQYSGALAAALTTIGVDARVERLAPPRTRTAGAPDLAGLVRTDDEAVVVQYNPFSYGHLGIAPGFVAALGRLRRGRPGLRIGLMCHETVALTPGWRWRGVRGLHRLQLAALIRQSDAVLVSTGAWRPTLRRLGAPGAVRLPVGSNLPDRRADRHAVRERLGARDALVVASFSTGHPSHRDDVLRHALRELLAARPDTVVLTLGAGRTALLGGPSSSVRELAPGFLPADELAGHLAAADLFLSPYVDGVSTRRGTVMAALQHGVPVLATTGESTDDDLAGLFGAAGVPFGDGAAAFAARAVAMADDPAGRSAHGEAGRRHYLASYDWPVLAAALRRVMPPGDGAGRPPGRRRRAAG